jgi:NADH-quinone oxidoreductase subunit L
VIHALSGEQDIMKMGGLRKKLPWTYWTFLLSTIAIAGFPPCAGFFSKDEILWLTVSTASKADWASWVHVAAYAMGILGAMITSFYMFRLVFMTFHGEQRSDIHVHHEMPVMSWPLAILATLATVGGLVNPSLFGGHWFKHFLEPVLGHAQEAAVAATALTENHAAEWGFAGLSVLVAIIGLGVAWKLYLTSPEIPAKVVESIQGLHKVVYNKYFVDELYEMSLIKPIHDFSVYLWKRIDAAAIDGFGVNGPPRLLRGLGGIGRLLQSGNVQAYAFWLFAGFAGALFYMVYVAGLF